METQKDYGLKFDGELPKTYNKLIEEINNEK
jgi:hypothetical protein